MNIPEGYKLVPIYPTDEMASAVIDLGRIDPDDVDNIWSGMIENSPFVCESNSPAYDEAKERELFTAFAMESFLSVHRGESRDYFYAETEAAWLGWKACAKSRARSAE